MKASIIRMLKLLPFAIITDLVLFGIVWLLIDGIKPYISPDEAFNYIGVRYNPDKANSANIFIDFRTTDNDDPQQRIFSRMYGLEISQPTLEKYPNCFVVAVQDMKNSTTTYDQDGSERRVSYSQFEGIEGEFPNIKPLEFRYATFFDSVCPFQVTQSLFGPYYVHEKAHSVDGVSRYFYPFDTMSIDTIIWVSPVDNTNKPLPLKIVPNLTINVITDPQWRFAITSSEIDDGIDKGNLVHILFQRQWLYRIITPTILVFILILIIAIPRIENIDTYLAALMGMLFGIWGLRQVLLPNNITWPTVLDPIIIVFYLLIVIGAILKFMRAQYPHSSPVANNAHFPRKRTVVRRINKKRH